MATFLVNAKMSPELAARVEASVRGGARPSGRAKRVRRTTSLLRLVLVVTLLVAGWLAVTSRQRSQRELEETRASLLGAADAAGKDLTPEDRRTPDRAQLWLARLSDSRPYEGDVTDGELRGAEAFAAELRRPMIYVRGPIMAFGGSTEATRAAAAASGKDALLLCLLERPKARKESSLLEQARIAYAGGAALEERTATVRRLHDAEVGLPFLEPSWTERVREAESAADLARLRQDFEHAPIERARRAAKAGLMLVALDEPGDGKGPTELDGERPHYVRVALVDLRGDRILLRRRLAVDPSWISPGRRPSYAAGLDSCALAYDLHERLQGATR
jgi:hypothetical protein